eukprot:Gb_32862 [translate_table: standard]
MDEKITKDEVVEESLSFGSLSIASNMEQAKALVLEIEENRHEAPIDLYQIMKEGYTTIRDELKGLMVFQKLKESWMEPSVIRAWVLNRCIKLVSKTLEASKDIKACGIKHNKETCSTLINGYVQLNDRVIASANFKGRMRAGFKPDVVTSSIIINIVCKSDNMNQQQDKIKVANVAIDNNVSNSFTWCKDYNWLVFVSKILSCSNCAIVEFRNCSNISICDICVGVAASTTKHNVLISSTAIAANRRVISSPVITVTVKEKSTL